MDIKDKTKEQLIKEIQELQNKMMDCDAVFESAPVAMLVVDETINIVMVNLAAVKLCGGSDSDILEHRTGNALRCVHSTKDARGCGYSPDCNTCALRNGIESIIAKGGSINGAELEFTLNRDESPKKVWMNVGVEPLIKDGRMHWCIALNDITESKQAEISLKESEESLRQAQAIAVIGNWVIDLKTWRLSLSQAALQIMGIESETGEVSHELIKSIALKAYRESLDEANRQLISSNIPYDQEYEIRRQNDGKVRWVRTKAVISGFSEDIPTKAVGVIQDITDRKQSEEKLRKAKENAEESEQKLNEAQDIARIGSWDWIAETDTVTWSKVLYDLLGHDPDKPAPPYKEHAELYTPDSFRKLQKAVEKCIETREPYELELEMVRKDKNIFNVLVRGRVKKDEFDKVTELHGTVMDINEQKKLNNELRNAKEKAEESEANITSIIQGTNNNIWAFNRNYQVSYINNTFQQHFLQSFGVLLKPGMNLIEALPEELKPLWKRRYDRALANEQFSKEDAVLTKKGTTYINVSFNPIVNDGQVIGVSCFGENITSRKLAEFEQIKAKDKAEESEHRLKLATASGQLGIWDWNLIENKMVWDDRMFELYGISKMDFPNNIDAWENGLHPEDKQKAIDECNAAIDGVKEFDTVFRVLHPDGKIFYIQANGLVVRNSEGVPIRMIGINKDITIEKNAEEELKESQLKLIESQKVGRFGTYELDIQKGIFKVSAIMAEIFGKDKLEHTIDEWLSYLHPEDQEMMSHYLMADVIPNKKSVDKKFRILSNNNIVWLHALAELTFNASGEAVALIGTSQDITEIKNYEEELIAAKEKAEESDRLKSAFLANMSHEIRTPMSGILGFTNLLKEPDLTGEQKQQFIEIIQKSGDRMLNTVNDIVEISRIEAGEIKVKSNTVNINKHLQTWYDFFRHEAKKKGIELTIANKLPEEQSLIETDKIKLSSIISNLIKNAIKYTDKGFIKIGCKKNKEFLEFYIEDSGIGIPADRIVAVFNRFEQADIKDTRVYEGSGLGLAIAKSYVDMLGGKIWVDSEENRGSVFYFTIPYVSASPDASELKKEATIRSIEKIKNIGKILIAEDEDDVYIYLSTILSKYSDEIIHAKNGNDVVELARSNPGIQLILMDIRMPGINGYDATQQIRKFNEEVIIVAQTAFAMTGDREKSIAAGCNDYISKPIKKGELVVLIQKYFKK